MNLSANEFQHQSRRTALQDHPLPEEFHWCLGVMGELGEIAEVYRGAVIASMNPSLGNANGVALSDEIGDLLWYLANLTFAYEIPFQDCMPVTDVLELSADLDGMWLKKLVSSVSGLMERIKKTTFYRQSVYDPISADDFRPILNCLQAMLYPSTVDTLEQCMAANVAKLQARYPAKFDR